LGSSIIFKLLHTIGENLPLANKAVFPKHNAYLSSIQVAEQGKPAEEKFNKIKQMYSKLRTEHVQLLRTVRQ
jgi:hypothetical protein